MPDDALIDGRLESAGWLDERGFQFGDGLFETLMVRDGRACLWDAHMGRLALGCERLGLPQPDTALLAAEADRLCSGRSTAVLKLYWTAGRSARGYRRPEAVRATRVLRCSDWPYAAPSQRWRLRQCQHRLGENPGLAGIKHLNRLDQVIARAEWSDPQIDEGVMLGQDGRVVCGTMTNLFVQSGSTLRTPPVDGAGIAGVVRGLALAIAQRDRHALVESPVNRAELLGADAVYLTNSLIGVVRVARFEDVEYDPAVAEHPLMSETRRLCHGGAAEDGSGG